MNSRYRQIALDSGVLRTDKPPAGKRSIPAGFHCRREQRRKSSSNTTGGSVAEIQHPLEVIDKWLYGLNYEENSLTNYGWLDYDSIRFEEASTKADRLARLNVVSRFERWVHERTQAVPFDRFA